jgi:hypothetical protein
MLHSLLIRAFGQLLYIIAVIGLIEDPPQAKGE